MLAYPACTAPAIQHLRVEVLREIPHDPAAFTQGLLFHHGSIYESTGQYGSSSLRRLSPETGAVEKRHDLPESLFGEGLALVDERLIQLTWKAGVALAYDLSSFEPLTRVRYPGEGWGLCEHQGELLMSNGSSWIVRRDPGTLRELERQQVRLEGEPIDQINELECAEGWVYANVWQEDHILRIDPGNGEVVAIIDASELRTRLGTRAERADALNGIAFRPDTATFFLTGKYWPKMFEVIFVE
jgi:glutaminyl-peptide cyclotransferase